MSIIDESAGSAMAADLFRTASHIPEHHIPLEERISPTSDAVVEHALCVAAAHRDRRLFGFLVGLGAPMTEEVVLTVIQMGDVEMLRAMLENGWDINAKDPNRSPGRPEEFGLAPLHQAILMDSLHLTSWLLDHGAEPNLHTDSGSSPLQLAASTSCPAVVEALLNHGAHLPGSYAVHAAASSLAPGRDAVIQVLLDRGCAVVDEMEPDPKGLKRKGRRTNSTGTPLHRAVEVGNPLVVHYLLSRGADPWARSWSGVTALQAAEAAEKDEIADLLRQWMGMAETCANEAQAWHSGSPRAGGWTKLDTQTFLGRASPIPTASWLMVD